MSTENTKGLLASDQGNPDTADIMAKNAKIIGENVTRLRKARGWTAAELARQIGVRIFTVQQIESGNTKKSRYLTDLSRVFGVPVSEIDPSQVTDSTHSILTKALPPRELVAHDLPLYRCVEAGDGALVINQAPYKWIERPAILEHVQDAYAVLVVGESMYPVLKPGNRVEVDPHLPPKREDLCIFVDDRDGGFTATIKEFVGQTADHWQVKRYQPEEKTFSLNKRQWRLCHVVVGVLYR